MSMPDSASGSALGPAAVAQAAAIRPDSVRLNVLALYGLQIASYVIPLLTIPWMVRHLGAEHYGLLAFSQAAVMYVVFFVDAGFNQSATRLITVNRDQPGMVAQYYWATQRMRVKLAIGGLWLLANLVLYIPSWREHWEIFLAQALMVGGTLAMPVWYFAGMEQMKYIAIFSVIGRLVSAAGIVLWVRGPDDLLLATLLQAGATFLSGLIAQVLILRRMPLRTRIERSVSAKVSAEGWPLFAAGFMQAAAAGSPIFILGNFASREVVGTFAAIDKLLRAVVSLFMPVLAALLPRATRAWAGGGPSGPALSRRVCVAVCGLAALLSGLIAIEAGDLLHVAFGADFADQGALLTGLAPWIFLNVSATVIGMFLYTAPGRQVPLARITMFGVAAQFMFATLFTWIGDLPGLAFGLVLAEAGLLTMLLTCREKLA